MLKFYKILIILAIISLPVLAIPKKFTIPGIGGVLSLYFIIIILILFLGEIILKKRMLNKKFLFFISGYSLWIFITSLYGSYNYPYYSLVNMSDSSVFMKFVRFVDLDPDNYDCKVIFMFMKSLIEGFRLFILPYVCSYVIYDILKSEGQKSFIFVRKGFILLVVFLIIYSIPEILLFKFNISEAKTFLESFNPYFYDVNSYLGWYPPAIWSNEQLRSYCIEPSMVGAIAGTVVPFLWSIIYEYKKLSYLVLYCLFYILPIMSKSRLAIVILICSWINNIIYFKSVKKYLKITPVIILFSVGAVWFAIVDFDNAFPINSINLDNGRIVYVQKDVIRESGSNISLGKEQKQLEAENDFNKYMEENVSTITSSTARSNGSRLINILSHLNVIIENPIMGTGVFFKDLYVRNNLVEDALDNAEIAAITNGLNNQHVFKYSYGNVNDYVFIATSIGLVGLFIHLLPIMYILYRFLKNQGYKNLYMSTVIIAISNSLVGMLSGVALIQVYILIGLSYILINDISSKGNHSTIK